MIPVIHEKIHELQQNVDRSHQLQPCWYTCKDNKELWSDDAPPLNKVLKSSSQMLYILTAILALRLGWGKKRLPKITPQQVTLAQYKNQAEVWNTCCVLIMENHLVPGLSPLKSCMVTESATMVSGCYNPGKNCWHSIEKGKISTDLMDQVGEGFN